jgi:AcrR family transcriptional regulator
MVHHPTRSTDITAPARLPKPDLAQVELTKPKSHRAKRGEGELLREQILDETERLIIELGDTDRVSIRMVADAVGRTAPSIYLHFATKHDLIRAVCQRQFDALTEVLLSEIDGVDDPVERIEVMGRAYVRFAVDHPEEYRVIFMQNSKHHDENIDDLQMVACFGMLIEAVKVCIDSGRFAPAEPTIVALSLWAVVHGVASLWIAHDDGVTWPDLDAQVEQCLRQNMHGLLAR